MDREFVTSEKEVSN